jgi:hypothetical protein
MTCSKTLLLRQTGEKALNLANFIAAISQHAALYRPVIPFSLGVFNTKNHFPYIDGVPPPTRAS